MFQAYRHPHPPRDARGGGMGYWLRSRPAQHPEEDHRTWAPRCTTRGGPPAPGPRGAPPPMAALVSLKRPTYEALPTILPFMASVRRCGRPACSGQVELRVERVEIEHVVVIARASRRAGTHIRATAPYRCPLHLQAACRRSMAAVPLVTGMFQAIQCRLSSGRWYHPRHDFDVVENEGDRSAQWPDRR